MNLSKDYKKLLDDEFDFVIKKMETSKTPDQMLYFFSGLYAMIHRVLNLQFSGELLLVHFVLEKLYKDSIERMDLIKKGHNVVMFNSGFGSKLIECTKELKKALYNSKQRQEALEKIVVLAYTSCGNGFYLTEKGMIDIFKDDEKEPIGLDLI